MHAQPVEKRSFGFKFTTMLIVVAAIISLLLILIFLYFLNIEGKNPNSIGDFGNVISALSGSLATTWLIVTILIQRIDLRNQVSNVEHGLSIAKDQVTVSLRLLEFEHQKYIRDQLDKKLHYLNPIITNISDELADVFEKSGVVYFHVEFKCDHAQEVGIPILPFLFFENSSEHDDGLIFKKYIHVSWYYSLQKIMLNITYIEESLSELYDLSTRCSYNKFFYGWLSDHKIAWISKHYEMLKNLESTLEDNLNIFSGINNDAARMLALYAGSRCKGSRIKIPFTEKYFYEENFMQYWTRLREAEKHKINQRAMAD